MVMKSAKIAELKARLSEYLREVRRGHTIAVIDRDTPVAKLIPYSSQEQSLTVRKPLGRHRSVRHVPLPPPLNLKSDVVELLLADRRGER